MKARRFVMSLVLCAVLLSTAVVKAGSNYNTYIPMVTSRQFVPVQVHLLSCKGALTFSESPDLFPSCPDGQPYPVVAEPGEGVILKAVETAEWTLFIHTRDLGNGEHQVAFQFGTLNPLKISLTPQNTLEVSKGDEIFAQSSEDITVDGWTLHRIGDLQAYSLKNGDAKIVTVFDGESLWIDLQIPATAMTGGIWKVAYDTGELPDLEEFVIERYALP